jgi:hypothetical protein
MAHSATVERVKEAYHQRVHVRARLFVVADKTRAI